MASTPKPADKLPPMTCDDWQRMADLARTYNLPLATEVFERRARELDALSVPVPQAPASSPSPRLP